MGTQLLAKAAGTGHRVIAAAVGRPPCTVRGWLRRFTTRAEGLRAVCAGLGRATGPIEFDGRCGGKPTGAQVNKPGDLPDRPDGLHCGSVPQVVLLRPAVSSVIMLRRAIGARVTLSDSPPATSIRC